MPDNFTIMFVCFGNTCRSPMAEGSLRKLFQNNGIVGVDVISSGTSGSYGQPATAYAIEAAKIWEADISGHRSQPLTEELIERADLILTMESDHCREVLRINPEADGKVYLLKKFPETGCHGDEIDDPIGGSLDLYNQTFLEIGEELGRIFPEIVERIRTKNNFRNDNG